MHPFRPRYSLVLAIVLLHFTALVVLAGTTLTATAVAEPLAGSTRYVAPGGNCAGATPCHSDLQAAVDAAGADDLIKVAAGTYSGVTGRTAPPGYEAGPAVITQVVYISKTLTIEGGYTTANWTTPNPEANPTTLDAQEQGRVLFVSGEISPTIAGLRLTGGDAEQLGGHPWGGGSDTGGGLHAVTATVTVRDCRIYSNTAAFGGGIYLTYAKGQIEGTEVTSNTAHWGGGIVIRVSGAEIEGSTVSGNYAMVSSSPAPASGGGIELQSEQGAAAPTVVISGNIISGNQSDELGGGISFRGDFQATVGGNTISANEAITGGGLYIQDNNVDVVSNTISYNEATQDGGGLYMEHAHDSIIRDNTFRENQAGSDGGGLASSITDASILDNEFRINSASGGGGLDLFSSSNTVMSGNLVSANTANLGAGIRTGMFDGSLTSNRIVSNVATGDGGGLWVFGGGSWTNNVIADNQAGGKGSAVYMVQGELEMRHTTIARNSGGDGSALYFTAAAPIPGPSNVVMTNTVLVDHEVGIRLTAGNAATVDGVLWHNTSTHVDAASGATVMLQNEHTGDPAFDSDGYHLTILSAAIDRGIDAGVAEDIDGEVRPRGSAPDLGVDEVDPVADLAVTKVDDADPVVVGDPLQYSLVSSNNGPAQATGVLLSDTLPGDVDYVSASAGCNHTDGVVTCDLGGLGAGDRVTTTITVRPITTGQLVNLAVVSGNEADPAPGNNVADELTQASADPVLAPSVVSVSPESGTNNSETEISIAGHRFQDGASVFLDGTEVEPVTFVSDQQLRAVVGSGLDPGTRDLIVTNPDGQSSTLPDAFTVLTPYPPAISDVVPGQGPNDIPVTIDIYGANFAPDAEVSLQSGGDDAVLDDVEFLDSTRLRAVVPVSITPALYDLLVTNPGDQVGTSTDAYQALEPAANNDLYAGEKDFWLDPSTVRKGDTPYLGLTVRRQGGQADLHNVGVRFFLEGGAPTFEETAAVLPPRSQVAVTAKWSPSPSKGEYVLYAQIDPADTVPENDETNNLISRTVTVLPALSDTTPPTVDKFRIDGGAHRSWDQTVKLDTWASDNLGGSGVSKLLFVEYVFVQSTGDWDRVRRSGWLSYKNTCSGYKWKMSARPGVHYFQVWAADRAGNISRNPKSKMINHMPSPSYVSYLQHRVYRVRLGAGDTLELFLCTGYGCEISGRSAAAIDQGGGGAWQDGVRLRLYSPKGGLLRSCESWGDWGYCRLSKTASTGGVYQFEVKGLASGRSAYYVTYQIKRAKQMQASDLHGPNEGTEDEPIISPDIEPGTQVGLPSAPLDLPRVYLPVVLRHHVP